MELFTNFIFWNYRSNSNFIVRYSQVTLCKNRAWRDLSVLAQFCSCRFVSRLVLNQAAWLRSSAGSCKRDLRSSVQVSLVLLDVARFLLTCPLHLFPLQLKTAFPFLENLVRSQQEVQCRLGLVLLK